jgi:hypothetical protein
MNYRNALENMLNKVIRKYGVEHRVSLWFATLYDKYIDHPSYENRELMERYFKKYMKNT